MSDPHNFQNILAAQLPTGHDDEPASLRQDILDELNDHLVCAWNRERMRSGMLSPGSDEAHGGDSENVRAALWERVEQRFGDPRALARRLWFDAMWSRIMNQRIQLTAICLLVATSLGSMALAWQSLAASRDLAAKAEASNAVLLEKLQAQANNAELLKELRALVSKTPAAPPASSQPREWNSLRIRCVAEKSDGLPLAGVKVTCSAVETPPRLPPKTVVTDKNGMADFGQVIYGQYKIETEVGEELVRKHVISVFPGENFEETIPCPPADSEAQVDLKVQLPVFNPPEADLTDSLKSKLWYHISLFRNGASDGLWSPTQSNRSGRYISVYVAPDGKLWMTTGSARQFKPNQYYEQPRFGGNREVEIVARPADVPLARYAEARICMTSDVQPVDRITLPLGLYEVKFAGLLIADDRVAGERAFFTFADEIHLPALSVDGGIGSSNQGRASVQLRSVQAVFNLTAAWPTSRPWVVPVPLRDLEVMQFLDGVPAGQNAVALLTNRTPGRSHPPVDPKDRIDFLLDQEPVLSGVPLFLRTLPTNPTAQFGNNPETEFLFCHLLEEEFNQFRPLQQPRFRQSPTDPRPHHFRAEIRPGNPDEQRGTLAGDFAERLKTPAAKPVRNPADS